MDLAGEGRPHGPAQFLTKAAEDLERVVQVKMAEV